MLAFLRRSKWISILFGIIISAILLNSANADMIRLKNGSTIEGIVKEARNGNVTIEMDVGTMTFLESEIESIMKSSDEEKAAMESEWERERKKAGSSKKSIWPAKSKPSIRPV